jgi:hypothetical protein
LTCLGCTTASTGSVVTPQSLPLPGVRAMRIYPSSPQYLDQELDTNSTAQHSTAHEQYSEVSLGKGGVSAPWVAGAAGTRSTAQHTGGTAQSVGAY